MIDLDAAAWCYIAAIVRHGGPYNPMGTPSTAVFSTGPTIDTNHYVFTYAPPRTVQRVAVPPKASLVLMCELPPAHSTSQSRIGTITVTTSQAVP